jgi:Uma2 family endonuclease
MAEKRQDYFAAGTKAVWDVDPDGPVVIRLYLAESPESPVEFHRGDVAHAEPILNGWELSVESLFD